MMFSMFRAALLIAAIACSPIAAGAQAVSSPLSRVTGNVVDALKAPIAGAVVQLTTPEGQRTAVTTADGGFVFERVEASTATLTIAAEHFTTRTVQLTAPATVLQLVLELTPLVEAVTVHGAAERRTMSAMRTDTPVRDVPQAMTTLPRELIADRSMRGMADAVNYVAGVGMAQGEGHRDAPIFRGSTSTSDFYVDGLRDDTQYVRDLYNVERLEVMKGPNGMIFGRGGAGGVINRVTRQANGTSPRELVVQGGSWNERRVAGDIGQAINSRLSARLAALYENSGSYRKGVGIERAGINPSFALRLGSRTTLTGTYEFFHDDRTVDRGVPSTAGRPLDIDPSTFFGSTNLNSSRATVHAASSFLEHRLGSQLTLRNSTRVANYDKFYQNVVPGAVSAAAGTVALTAYNNASTRTNVFSQTDAVWQTRSGGIGHTVLGGFEIGRQASDSRRLTGFFPTVSPTSTSIVVPLSNPTTTAPVDFRASATDTNNHSTATVAAIYAHDQIELHQRLQVVVGVRYDRFDVDLDDRRTNTALASHDGLLSPRAGVIYKPVTPLSLYASYSRSHAPRAGEQLGSLSLTTQALEPENFRNYEVGAKWDISPSLAFTTAAYRLRHGNVVVRDAVDPTLSHLVEGDEIAGLEIELSGRIASRWTVQGAYALQDGEIIQSSSATVLAGARMAQVPRHSFSLWNKYDVTRVVGLGVGVISLSDRFVATDNTVVLPAFIRVDGALFVNFTPRLRAHVNVDNLFDERYFASAHTNNNIAPGAPRTVRVALTTRF